MLSVRQLDLIFKDAYQLDTHTPPLNIKWSSEYKRASYSQWATGELRNYILKKLRPREEGTIEEIGQLVKEFERRMRKYSKLNPASECIFKCAEKRAADFYDLLQAMK